MNRRKLTPEEISKQSYDELMERGYTPVYTDDEKIDFECKIGGVLLNFSLLDYDGFKYSVGFNLKKELTAKEKEHLKQVYLNTNDGVFETFFIEPDSARLCTVFIYECYPEDFIDMAIKVLTDPDGIVAKLKAKSYVEEEN